MFEVSGFIEDTRKNSGGDKSIPFKLLGFMVYVAQEGEERLLSGELISPRTYHRWVEKIRRAGWGNLLLDAKLRQVVNEYIHQRFDGLPINHTRIKVLDAVSEMMNNDEARSLKAISRQASAGVKGLAAGREIKTSALDDGADGGSLGQATAPATTGMQNG